MPECFFPRPALENGLILLVNLRGNAACLDLWILCRVLRSALAPLQSWTAYCVVQQELRRGSPKADALGRMSSQTTEARPFGSSDNHRRGPVSEFGTALSCGKVREDLVSYIPMVCTLVFVWIYNKFGEMHGSHHRLFIDLPLPRLWRRHKCRLRNLHFPGCSWDLPRTTR